MSARKRRRPKRKSPGRRIVGGAFALLIAAPVTYLGFCSLWLVAYNVVPPPITGVQIQRLVEYVIDDGPVRHSYRPVSQGRIASHMRHAAVAAEDGRFYEHNGIDLDAIREAIDDNRRRGSTRRGGSTITQQLVKNLFMTTHRSYVRKAMEIPLALIAEIVLPKDRILTLYLNVVELDRGVYGVEAAARHYYNTSAVDLSRRQSAALAACLPAPRRRSPHQMDWYTNIVLGRMTQMGW